MQLPPTVLSGHQRIKVEKSKGASKSAPSISAPEVESGSSSRGEEASKDSSERKGDKITALKLKPSNSLSTTLFKRLERLHGEPIKKLLRVQYR
jgi:hypothetical protein